MSNPITNEFSLLCRLFGNLFYRHPEDPILTSTFAWLAQGNLRQHWPLATDTQSEQALLSLEKGANPVQQGGHYQALFAKNGAIAPTISAYGFSVDEFVAFRQQRGMPELENADHVGLLLLTASWIEDNLDSTAAQRELFERFLLPVLGKFLGQVEAFDTGFYKALAQLTRDALSAMADELEETDE
ncbi:MAG: molecular chaperone [Pasteurellaceae bacterium]|nr:molecular chaperone [Pasteurellaceae bacterium]